MPEQEAHIQKLICDKRPEQLKMDFFLWSRSAVMQLIEQECGLELGVRTVGKYFRPGAAGPGPEGGYYARIECVRRRVLQCASASHH